MKRAEQLEKTRQAILKTATKLFLQKGFGETSTRDIAKQIGITQPALYHHFSDKEVLYLDVMTNLCGKVRQDINKVMRKHDLSPNDQYNQAMRLLSKSAQQKLNMIFTMDYLEPIAAFFRQPDVGLRPDILPKEAAELFIAGLTPIFGTSQLIGGHSITPEQRDQLILDCIINGLSNWGGKN